jgi:hypothetical protein
MSLSKMPELFENFEVNKQPRWPVLLRLVGGSLALHLTALACVIYIPPLRDALNIAALAARAGYVDRPYTKTDIGENVHLVQIGERFQYPPGYFATELPPTAPAGVAPKIISQARISKPVAMPTPSPPPQPSPSPVMSPSPSGSANPTVIVKDNGAQAEPKTPEEAEKELDKIASQNEVIRPNEEEINKRPLKDWLARANALREKGELDLSSVVEITIKADLNPDCKLSNSEVDRKSGDPRLLEVAKDMVSAISDSGTLSFLRDPQKQKDDKELRCDSMPLYFTVKLDQNEISATVTSEADSPARASQMARGYNGLLTVGQFAKRGHDEEVLYKSTKVTAEGKQIIVSFSMPRQAAGEMLKRQLPAS